MRPQLAVLSSVLGLLVAACDTRGGFAVPYSEPVSNFAVVGRSPSPGHEGIPVTASIILTFSENIDPATVRQGSVTLNGAGYGTLTVQGNVLKLVPATPLVADSGYQVATSPQIAGLNGITLGPTPTWGFKTAGPRPDTATVLATRSRTR